MVDLLIARVKVQVPCVTSVVVYFLALDLKVQLSVHRCDIGSVVVHHVLASDLRVQLTVHRCDIGGAVVHFLAANLRDEVRTCCRRFRREKGLELGVRVPTARRQSRISTRRSGRDHLVQL
uniref:Uncharacterized protein n=1 Tax=Cacopsylla melanoneura TaxID=428564 RepID=A0A8D8M1V8_9HEMI